jgi:hypothetical protein
MNLFYLSDSPDECAQFHCNKHVVKMILEYAQMLSVAHRVMDGHQKPWRLPDEREATLYKVTHQNHPTSIWVRQNIETYAWTVQLLKHLLDEYTVRYGKVHKVQKDGLDVLLSNPPTNLNIGAFIEPPQAMPEEFRVAGDSIRAYRNYYIKDKFRFAKWSVRQEPYWWIHDHRPTSGSFV